MRTFAKARPTSDRPSFRPEVTEQLLSGVRLLRQAFFEKPQLSVERDQTIVSQDGGTAPIFLVQRGVAFRSCTLANGRRAILDLLLPGDIGGLEHAVLRRPNQDIVSAGILSYRTLSSLDLHRLITDPAVALSVLALMAEARSRMDQHTAAVARLPARERLCTLLLDLYDRLHQRGLIARPTFNLPLTQEQIADYLGLTMVHVNRTLRQLREERLVLIDRQVVIIIDLPRLRDVVHAPPMAAPEQLPFSMMPELSQAR